MSTLAADTITNVAGSSAGTTITIDKDSTYNSEGAAVTQNLVQGVIKAWADVDQTGTMTVDNSLNIASGTDLSAGNFTLNFTNNMGNADYGMAGAAHQMQAGNDEGVVCFQLPDARTTGDCDLRIVDVYNAASPLDYDPTTAMFYGDLA